MYFLACFVASMSAILAVTSLFLLIFEADCYVKEVALILLVFTGLNFVYVLLTF
jgi:hypothetical protein